MYRSHRFISGNYPTMVEVVDDDFTETVECHNAYQAVIDVYSKRGLNVGSALARAVRWHMRGSIGNMDEELAIVLNAVFQAYNLLPQYQTELDTFLMLL